MAFRFAYGQPPAVAAVHDGLDSQATLDRPGLWVDGELVRLEEGLWERAEELERIGYQGTRNDTFGFGGGQARAHTSHGSPPAPRS